MYPKSVGYLIFRYTSLGQSSHLRQHMHEAAGLLVKSATDYGIGDVVFLCAYLQMVGVDAATVIASMSYNLSVRYFAFPQSVSKPMNLTRALVSDVYLSVPAWI